jgi:hypothetical protein
MDIAQYIKQLKEFISTQLPPVTTAWAVVTEVDLDAKTMTCKSVKDSLEWFDVSLGLGSTVVEPKVNTKVLVGCIESQDANRFMIWCEEMESFRIANVFGFIIELKAGKMTINGDKFGGLVDAKELKLQVDKNTKVLEKIQQAFSSWTVIPNDGGAALKGLSAQFTGLPTADLSNIENTTIMHGNG